MKIDELIELLESMAEGEKWAGSKINADILVKAAETIRLLWEVAKESYEAKYQMQFDKEAANNGG